MLSAPYLRPLALTPFALLLLSACGLQTSSKVERLANGAAVYYIAPGGDDNNPGTIDAPWRDIGNASSMMSPGDMAYLRGGTYTTGSVYYLAGSGAPGAPLTFRAYPGETPVLSLDPVGDGYSHDTLQIYGSYVVVDKLRLINRNDPGAGIWVDFSAHDVTVSNCEISGVLGTGLMVGGSHNTFYRNSIHDNGAASHGPMPGDHGIYIAGDYNVIQSNLVYNNKTNGIQLYYGDGDNSNGHNTVDSNYVYH